MLAGVGHERDDEQRGNLDEPRGEVGAHAGVAVAPDAIGVSRGLQVVVPALERLSEHHVLVVVLGLRDGRVDGVREHLIGEGGGGIRGPERTVGGLLPDGFDPLELFGEPENGGVRGVVDEVGVLDAVARVGEGEPHGIRGVLLDRRLERLEVAGGLGHLLAVEQEVPVGAEALGPLALVLVPDGGVVVDGEREVVLDEVLARDAQVEGVPKVELCSHLVE